MSKEDFEHLNIERKLDDVARLLRDIDEISNSHGWIIGCNMASTLLEKVDEWRAIHEFHRKIGNISGVSTDEVRERCREIEWSSNAETWIKKKIGE